MLVPAPAKDRELPLPLMIPLIVSAWPEATTQFCVAPMVTASLMVRFCEPTVMPDAPNVSVSVNSKPGSSRITAAPGFRIESPDQLVEDCPRPNVVGLIRPVVLSNCAISLELGGAPSVAGLVSSTQLLGRLRFVPPLLF